MKDWCGWAIQIGRALLSVAGLVLLWALPPLWYAYVYRPFPEADPRGDICDGIPRGSVAFGLAFWDVRQEGRIVDPGAANAHLARWLFEHRSCVDAILVQESIWMVWEEQQLLQDGMLGATPVYRMHRHIDGLQPPVRTLEALQCGLHRFAVPPGAIVLAAHDKQVRRAFKDLERLYGGQIINPQIAGVPYPDERGKGPFAWAWREVYAAAPGEWLLREFGDVICRREVTLPELPPR